MIFVNFKTYKEATAGKAVDLAQHIVSVQTETRVPIIPVVQAVDARLCVNTSGYMVWIQHLDWQELGQTTGWVTVEGAAETGIAGAFLNHSEHKMGNDQIQMTNDKCKKIGLETMIFASDIEELKRVVGLKPSFVAYEPPELIASPDTSVAKSQPKIISEAAKIAKEAGIRLIVGAGIKNGEDVKVSVKQGAFGVAVSSAVVLAPNPREVLSELAGCFSKI
ncbi:MAG: triose-phosphate isomerase [Candidatus Blackburnbacteria bacterium]|nr:triose-phosphate isomerase [Candidatus Blackburnbacteria bacterium]